MIHQSIERLGRQPRILALCRNFCLPRALTLSSALPFIPSRTSAYTCRLLSRRRFLTLWSSAHACYSSPWTLDTPFSGASSLRFCDHEARKHDANFRSHPHSCNMFRDRAPIPVELARSDSPDIPLRSEISLSSFSLHSSLNLSLGLALRNQQECGRSH